MFNVCFNAKPVSEAAVYAKRAYVMCNVINPECNKIIVEVGIRNAFDSAEGALINLHGFARGSHRPKHVLY